MKNIELKLIAELMQNSRRSDRELAKRLGVSQPTVTRTRTKLEEEGIIKEYTLIPDFSRIGFKIMAVNFVKFSNKPSEVEVNELKSIAEGLKRKGKFPTTMVMMGIGLGFDRAMVTFHKDYSSYSQFLAQSRELSSKGIAKFESFLIDLSDKTHHYQLPTFAALGQYLLKQE